MKHFEYEGEFLKALRASFDLTQTDFGKKSKISSATLSLIESGERSITSKTINNIIKAFDISVYISPDGKFSFSEKDLSGETIELIKYLENHFNISKKDIAKSLYTSVSTIHLLDTKKQKYSLSLLSMICSKYNLCIKINSDNSINAIHFLENKDYPISLSDKSLSREYVYNLLTTGYLSKDIINKNNLTFFANNKEEFINQYIYLFENIIGNTEEIFNKFTLNIKEEFKHIFQLTTYYTQNTDEFFQLKWINGINYTWKGAGLYSFGGDNLYSVDKTELIIDRLKQDYKKKLKQVI